MKKRGWQGLRLRQSYIGKLTLGSIFLAMIPLTIAMVITGARISDYLQRMLQQQADQAVASLQVTLEQFFSGIKEMTVLPIYDTGLQQILALHSDPDQEKYLTFEERRRATEIFGSVVYEKKSVRQTEIYLRDGYILSASNEAHRWDETEREWMELCDGDPYETFILPWEDTVALVRMVLEPLTERRLGYIKVELQPDAIEALIEDSSLPAGSAVTIYNQAQQCIYPADQTGENTRTDGGTLTSFVTSPQTNLKVQVQMSMETVRRGVSEMMGFAALVLVAAFAVSALLAIAAARRITVPIMDLKEKMALVEDGRFNTRMQVQSQDEIGQLEEMFNNMTASIETLIHEVYEETLASKQAQISALQSQINPHFLYNTLETINMMAISKENYDVSEAISTLGQMMHYCVSNDQHFARLQEELDFARAYYSLQKLRFENLRSMQVDVPPECLDKTMPKLLLQPFVENIVQHGLNTGMLDIVLTVRPQEDGGLEIVIQNNGTPMEPQERRRVVERLRETESLPVGEPWQPAGHGYGLANVHRRLRLLYGEKGGVFLDESYVNGVRFIVRLRDD